PGPELREREKGRKHRRDERADERDVVQHERDHAPRRRQFEAGEEGKPHTTSPVSTLISLRTSMYFWNLPAICVLACRMVCATSSLPRCPMCFRAVSPSSRPSAVNTKGMTTNATRPCSLRPTSCTARMSQPALKFSTSRLVTSMPCSSSQSVDWM